MFIRENKGDLEKVVAKLVAVAVCGLTDGASEGTGDLLLLRVNDTVTATAMTSKKKITTALQM